MTVTINFMHYPRVAVTGKLKKFTRKTIETFIVSNRMQFTENIQQAKYLICNDKTGTSEKLIYALKYGHIVILTEQEFIDAVSSNPTSNVAAKAREMVKIASEDIKVNLAINGLSKKINELSVNNLTDVSYKDIMKIIKENIDPINNFKINDDDIPAYVRAFINKAIIGIGNKNAVDIKKMNPDGKQEFMDAYRYLYPLSYLETLWKTKKKYSTEDDNIKRLYKEFYTSGSIDQLTEALTYSYMGNINLAVEISDNMKDLVSKFTSRDDRFKIAMALSYDTGPLLPRVYFVPGFKEFIDEAPEKFEYWLRWYFGFDDGNSVLTLDKINILTEFKPSTVEKIPFISKAGREHLTRMVYVTSSVTRMAHVRDFKKSLDVLAEFVKKNPKYKEAIASATFGHMRNEKHCNAMMNSAIKSLKEGPMFNVKDLEIPELVADGTQAVAAFLEKIKSKDEKYAKNARKLANELSLFVKLGLGS